MTSPAWRRMALATAVGARIRAEADRIAEEREISQEEAASAVFQDPELLARCHQVGGVPVPDPPVSDVAAQNKAYV